MSSSRVTLWECVNLAEQSYEEESVANVDDLFRTGKGECIFEGWAKQDWRVDQACGFFGVIFTKRNMMVRPFVEVGRIVKDLRRTGEIPT